MKTLKKHRKAIYTLNILLLLGLNTSAQSPPISVNWYRIPYANNTTVTISRDYIDHGSTPSGVTGPMDMNASTANQIIVAAADGTVRFVQESRTECGCNSSYSGCANRIDIEHANGEWTRYLHIQANSATRFSIGVGTAVQRGQAIAVEGDVGWTCGSGRTANSGSCVTTIPAGAGRCGRHLHFEVRRGQNGPFLNPKICSPGVSSHIFQDNATYTADDCTDGVCDGTVSFPAIESNTMKVYSVSGSLTSSVDIRNTASIEYQATNSITLRPNFKVASNGYFRASINACTNIEGVVTSADDKNKDINATTGERYFKVYPNPFSSSATLEFTIDEPENISSGVYDLYGRLVLEIASNQPFRAGDHKLEINASDLANGIYFVMLQNSKNRQTKKITITK